MSTTHNRAPDLEGFTFIESIGKGGFAEVFLYQQKLPSMRVAIKVLRESAEGAGRDLFHAEANVMAQLSGHPSIVPIYGAGVSPDGRPYLVMEYCPPPHLAARFRAERIPVPEVLEIGVRVSSAAETAHRAGILHRDIKPLNILTSAYGAPMLSDFGIAATTGETGAGAAGVSIPWSPPEAFGDDGPGDVRSDVFSIGATLYSLLAGRSPFEVPGAANDDATLMSRIERQPLQRINRADVPDSLNRLLERSMSKRVEDRYPTAMALARALQEVQIELHISPTKVEVLDGSPAAETKTADDDRTRVRPVSIIVPDSLAESGTRLRPVVVPSVPEQTMAKVGRAAAVPDTRSRAGAVVADRTDGSHFLGTAPNELPADPQESPVSRTKLVVGGAVVVIIAMVVGLSFVLGGDPDKTDKPTFASSSEHPDAVIGGEVPAPRLSQRSTGAAVELRWTNADPKPGDTFKVFIEKNGGATTVVDTSDLSRQVTIPKGEAWRITVKLVRSNAQGSAASNALLVVGPQ